ncbi:MAG: translocation/assembly module TamB domain-containing protein [Prevotella sp.]|jgi:hypothetical protein
MRKLLKWGSVTVGMLLALVILLFLLFYFPPFQNWMVKQAARYASEQTGMAVSIEHVRLSFPLDLSLEGFKALKPNDSIPQKKDTIANVKQLIVNVQLLPLFHGEVNIQSLDFKQLKVNTDHFIPSTKIQGEVGRLYLGENAKVNWKDELAYVPVLHLHDALLDIALSDTVPPDTTPSTNFWRINAGKLDIQRSQLTLHLPGDTLSVDAKLGNLQAQNVKLNLGKGQYEVAHIDWSKGAFCLDQNFVVPKREGIDASHLSMQQLLLRADSFYYCDSELRLALRQCHFREKSGIVVDNLVGPVYMDSTLLRLDNLRLTTPNSKLQAKVNIALNAFDSVNPGTLSVIANGQLGKQDLMLLVASQMPQLRWAWPNYPLSLDANIIGNLKKAHIKKLNVLLPTAFRLNTNGTVANIDSPNQLFCNLRLKAQTFQSDFLTSLLGSSLPSTLALPWGVGFNGDLRMNGQQIASRFNLSQGGGNIHGQAAVNLQRMAYKVQLTANRFPLQHFVKGQPLHPFTGTLTARGLGTDPLSPTMRLKARARISSSRYGDYDLSNTDITANIGNGHLRADLLSENEQLNGHINIDALTGIRRLKATVGCDLTKADLYALKLSGTPLTVALCAHVDVASDLKNRHRIMGNVSDITITDKKKVFRPDDITMDVLSTRDTTHAEVTSGDLYLNMDARGGYERLLAQLKNVAREMDRQLTERYIDHERLRARLPLCQITFHSGNNNLLFQLLQRYDCTARNLAMELNSSPKAGLNGYVDIDSLVVDSIQLDTIRLKVNSDSTTTRYFAQVRNGKNNPSYTFNALFDGEIQPRGTSLLTRVYDKNDRLGIKVNLAADMQPHGVSVHLQGDPPILGYKEFSVNDSNYIYLRDDRRVSADMVLQSADGMGLQIFTNDEDTTALQDLTLSLHQFKLGEVLALLPYTPDVEGVFDGDFHIIKTTENVSLSSAVDVQDLVYQGWAMGDVSSEFTYMPKADGSHYVNGTLSSNDREVATFDGTYQSAGNGSLDASLDLDEMPLQLVNGFIPDKLFGFKGTGDGTLSVKGSLDKPVVNGEIYLDSAYVFSEPYGVEMRFANDPVTISNSKLLFENFEMFAHNNQPLNVQGSFDFSDMNAMNLDVRMRAQNFLLVDSKETFRSEAYGKAYVNFFGSMRGRVDNLQLRGRLDVLGSTSLKYNLKDSPLTTDNQFNDLVKFTNFEDTVADVVNRPPLTGFNMDLSIGIDEGAHMDCYLNADHSNYIDVSGGGTMRLQYNNIDDLRLTGRYTISEGEMKYSLPVIPLKTFTIHDGSYIEFRGEAMNPTLNITATEETKASVSSDGSQGSIVQFTCGVVVTQTLNNMGLEFIIDAPEDLTIHNQLQSMSKEERGKLAVTMLTTGMYLADGNTSSFTMNSALSAFLNSQINQISNSALRSLDVSFGMENTTDATGSIHTDYNFKFAKRFWNNRLRVIIGGKLSSGSNVEEDNQTFFDNVTFEYRLSDTSNKYLRLFYERESYDWLEGNVSKFGGGFTWKRKLSHFKDLFRWGKENKDYPPMMKNDSTAKTKQK